MSENVSARNGKKTIGKLRNLWSIKKSIVQELQLLFIISKCQKDNSVNFYIVRSKIDILAVLQISIVDMFTVL